MADAEIEGDTPCSCATVIVNEVVTFDPPVTFAEALARAGTDGYAMRTTDPLGERVTHLYLERRVSLADLPAEWRDAL